MCTPCPRGILSCVGPSIISKGLPILQRGMNHFTTTNTPWEDSVDFWMRKSRVAVEAGDVVEQKESARRPSSQSSTDMETDGYHMINPSALELADKRQQASPVESVQRPGLNALNMARKIGAVPREDDDVLDLICIGFGPASLAIAIALADTYAAVPHTSSRLPRVVFLEKQDSFAWHAGMQIPEAKMQISFLKDMATPRDPTSPFSFINYLHQKGRLSQFINLGTFLPSRLEYEDYMRWCADHFKNSVLYGQDVNKVERGDIDPATGRVKTFTVSWKSVTDHQPSAGPTQATARRVVVAAGGKPYLPEEYQALARGSWPRIKHSSQYVTTIKQWDALEAAKTQAERAHKNLVEKVELLLKQHRDQMYEVRARSQDITKENSTKSVDGASDNDPFRDLEAETRNKLIEMKTDLDEADAAVCKAKDTLHAAGLRDGDQRRFVVVGSGQSAVEIFNDLWSRFPEAYVTLIIRGASLRPSDDSPFVNEVFDPERVDGIYSQDPVERAAALKLDRGTNYGVVRLNLLEHIYEKLYMQHIKQPDESKWKHRIITNRVAKLIEEDKDGNLVVKLGSTSHGGLEQASTAIVEQVTASHIFVATGYLRNAHEEMLKDTIDCLPSNRNDSRFPVARDYRVLYDPDKVDGNCGIWLQGCNERTHGLADSLLSILAVRGGEMVQSIFGAELAEQASAATATAVTSE